MKRLIALIVLVAAACASTPDRLAGRYAVVIEPELQKRSWGVLPSDETIVEALRGRLQSVDLVSSRDVQGYDAVIVLSRGPSGRWYITPPEPRAHSGPVIRLIHYEVVRAGRVVSTGDARVESSWPPSSLDIDANATDPGSTHHIRQAYAGGIEVARVVAKALRD